MLYYTDYIFIAPAVVTAITVGGKIWDAVNDMIFGMIVDKVRFKAVTASCHGYAYRHS